MSKFKLIKGVDTRNERKSENVLESPRQIIAVIQRAGFRLIKGGKEMRP